MSTSRNLAAVILAAGQGKRMKSDLPKVLHKVAGKPMVEHVIGQATSSGAKKVVVIVGHKKELVIEVTDRLNVDFAVQKEQLGTGDAVKAAKESLEDFDGDVLVLSGDVPLLSQETITSLMKYHQHEEAVATVVTAIAEDPTGYGRVLRGDDGLLFAIREHKDCNEEEIKVDEINSGIYLFDSKVLFEALGNLTNDNAQGEYYLTDVFSQFFDKGLKVGAYTASFDEIHGVNDIEGLKKAEEIYIKKHISA